MNMTLKKGIFLLTLVLLSASVNAAYGAHLNVTIVETIFQQNSFAENFTLDEWQKTCYSLGVVNISNPNTEPVFEIYLRFINTGNLPDNFSWVPTSKFGNQTSGQPGTPIILYIPELRQGNYSTFTYNISCMGQIPALNVNTAYTNSDHGFNRKVLAGYNWTINQTVINQNTNNKNISGINITLRVGNVTWNDSQFDFSLHSLYGTGDYLNVYGNATSTTDWWWAPNAGALSVNQSANITYLMRAPYSVPFTASYLALEETLIYTVDDLLSNLTLTDINGTADIEFSLDKRISQPSDNAQNHNVTWEVAPQITVPVNITFDLYQVSLWVTRDQNPLNKTNGTIWGQLDKNYTGTPLKQINLTTSFGNSTYRWYFNYTDGTNDTNPPPIVWMRPDWLIANQQGQILNYTSTVSGRDMYLKYIYVIHGYWLEVRKNITNIAENSYQVDVIVENIGNGWTPEFTYVTVYDYVPQEFVWWNLSNGGCPSTQCTNQSVGAVGQDYYGTSFRWNIPWKGTMNASLGPKLGPSATSWSNYSWNVSYRVNGSGTYRVTELYIVGLDPLKVDGAYTSPIITIISGIQSRTNEILYLSVIAFLIVINITNLVITNRIHRKLSERLPPAPPPKQ
jgi:hypothetical protein